VLLLKKTLQHQLSIEEAAYTNAMRRNQEAIKHSELIDQRKSLLDAVNIAAFSNEKEHNLLLMVNTHTNFIKYENNICSYSI
jgi:hypothetical protein